METKVCKICNLEKSTDEFGIQKKKYLNSRCKNCDNLYQKTYRKKNKALIAKKDSVRSKSLNSKFTAYKYCAKDRGYDFKLTKEEFATFWQQPCFYCGDKVETVGIDRIDNSVGYELTNCVSCCSTCNQIKMTMDFYQLRDHLTKMIKRMS